MTPEEGYAEAQRRIRDDAESDDLDLQNLGLVEIPPELFSLTQLKILELGSNKLSTLPDEIGRLTKLERLYVSKNQLTELPESLKRITNLKVIQADRNKLSALPESICELRAIRKLSLWENRITSIPRAIGNLKRLTNLQIWANQITELPRSLGDLRQLKEFNVGWNPLTFPPPEIVAQGTTAILEFLRNSTHLIDRRTAKMVFVGEPKVGKTTLFRVLNNLPARPDEDETHGMRVEILDLPHPAGGEPMHLSTWDFGGQHILHATHQFFLTDGALFVLIWSSREGVEKGRLNYWLDMIAARAPSSPILLVSTGSRPVPARP